MLVQTLRPLARRTVRRLASLAVPLMAPAITRAEPGSASGQVDALLVIRLDLLGDVVMSRQATQGLRESYPGARIVMLTLPYTAPLARSYPEVDEVVSVDTNRIRRPAGLLNPATWVGYWLVLRKLRRHRFDLAVSLSGPMASLWAGLSGARERVAFEAEAYAGMLTAPVAGGRYATRMHEVEYVRALARAGGAARFPERLDVPVDPQASRRVDVLLRRVGVAGGESLVLVHAGALNGEAKRWPPKYWARFADELQRLTPSRVALIGARGDLPIAQQVIESAAFPVESFVGNTTIEELVALIARADLIATGDSGPLHLAVALGRPLVAVYGPTDPAIHGPFQPTAPVALHRRDLPCSPCYTMAASAECPLGDPICMRLVTVPEVVESAMRLLNGSAARAKDQLLVAQQDALEDAERRECGDK